MDCIGYNFEACIVNIIQPWRLSEFVDELY